MIANNPNEQINTINEANLQKEKKRWLYSFIIFLIYSIFVWGESYFFYHVSFMFTYFSAAYVLGTVVYLAWYRLLYHCCYKDNGTMCIMIYICFSTLSALLRMNFGSYITVIITLPIFLWIYMNLRLYFANKKYNLITKDNISK